MVEQEQREEDNEEEEVLYERIKPQSRYKGINMVHLVMRKVSGPPGRVPTPPHEPAAAAVEDLSRHVCSPNSPPPEAEPFTTCMCLQSVVHVNRKPLRCICSYTRTLHTA